MKISASGDLVSSLQELMSSALALLRLLVAFRDELIDIRRRFRQTRLSYENLALEVVLDIQDRSGARAVLERRQSVRFLVDDSCVVRDLVWGDGRTLASYRVSGARRLGLKKEGPKSVVLLAPRSRVVRGERALITSRRLISCGFTETSEYMETLLERPTRRVAITVLFPNERPPAEAQVVASTPNEKPAAVPVRYVAGGRPVLSWNRRNPASNTTYSLRWSW